MSRLFVFDMDGTLLPSTTAMLQIAKVTGHSQELEVLEKQYVERQIDNSTFSKGIYDLWKDLTPELVSSAFKMSPKIENIRETLEEIHSRNGISCLITSAADFFAQHFSIYGFKYIFASKPFNLHEKIFTPEHILHGKDKPLIAQNLCASLQLQFEDTVAFGDSISDIPLFQNLTHTISVNGDVHIKEFAKHHYVGSNLMEALGLITD